MQITLDGRTLHYEIHGTGAPILFLHGFPLSGEVWTPLVPALEGTFRLIIPDLRGRISRTSCVPGDPPVTR